MLLRNALAAKTQDAHKEVYCWQVCVLAREGKEGVLLQCCSTCSFCVTVWSGGCFFVW